MITRAPARSHEAPRAEEAQPSFRSGPSRGQGLLRRPGHGPIVAAVDGSASGLDAAKLAARLASDLQAPLVFVCVRRGPWTAFGEPYYQRRLNAELGSARRTLTDAKALARREGVTAEGEILEGPPARRVLEFAQHRHARLVVVGSRRRRVGRSLAGRVMRAADRPVLVAGGSPAPAVGGVRA